MASLTDMIEQLGLSADPMMRLISGFCYVVGFNLFWVSTKKFNKMADWRARGGTGGPTFIPISYMLGGAAFVFLPTMLDVARNSFFGSSPIGYTDFFGDLQASYGNFVYATMRLINLAGLVWFVRGVSLLTQSSEQGIQHGPKGLWFVVAGIFALNVEYSEAVVSYALEFITASSN